MLVSSCEINFNIFKGDDTMGNINVISLAIVIYILGVSTIVFSLDFVIRLLINREENNKKGIDTSNELSNK